MVSRRWILGTILTVNFLTGCALFQGGGTLNEAAPNMPVISAGNINGVGTYTAAGGVAIYGNTGDTSTILRFTGLSLPAEGPFYIYGSLTGGTLNGVYVRSISGSYNTTISVPASATWSLITIKNGSNVDYAQAIMN